MIKRFWAIALWCTLCVQLQAQELFVLTEPASNMPAKSLGVRVMNAVMQQAGGSHINYHAMPELMWGINKNWMVHAQGFISNRSSGGLRAEGGSLYAKYRFYSNDNVHSHFRMAAYGRYSFNNSDIHQDEIETMGHNTGYELGLVATQLLHKLAISSSVSFEKALNNGNGNKLPAGFNNNAINYTLSAGMLILPVRYTGYQQLNLNIMVELLGQRLHSSGKSFLDVAPAVQLIINSQARIDVAWRKQLYSNMLRTAPNGIVLKLEYTFFNVFKKK
jgi:hypothetical protein